MPARVTIQDGTVYVTYRPRPDKPSLDVDVLAIALA